MVSIVPWDETGTGDVSSFVKSKLSLRSTYRLVNLGSKLTARRMFAARMESATAVTESRRAAIDSGAKISNPYASVSLSSSRSRRSLSRRRWRSGVGSYSHQNPFLPSPGLRSAYTGWRRPWRGACAAARSPPARRSQPGGVRRGARSPRPRRRRRPAPAGWPRTRRAPRARRTRAPRAGLRRGSRRPPAGRGEQRRPFLGRETHSGRAASGCPSEARAAASAASSATKPASVFRSILRRWR